MDQEYIPSIYETTDFHSKTTELMDWWNGLSDEHKTTLINWFFDHPQTTTLTGSEIKAIYEFITEDESYK